MRNQATDAVAAVAADEDADEDVDEDKEQQQAEAGGDVLGEDPTSPMISMLQPKG